MSQRPNLIRKLVRIKMARNKMARNKMARRKSVRTVTGGLFALFAVSFCLPGIVIGQTQVQNSSRTESATKPASPLIQHGELANVLGDANVRVVEICRKEKEYLEGHIPNAAYLDWVKDITDPAVTERYVIIDKVAMERLLSRLGIAQETTVIVADDLNSRLSARFYWTLKYYGHEHVRILDGGRPLWAKHHKLSKVTPKLKPTNYRIDHINEKYATNMKFIADHLNDPQVTLIDGRPAKQYSGEQPGKVFHTGTAHQKKGHIPGAIHVFWKDNFNEDGTFKTAEKLKKLYESAGIRNDRTLVTYCNEGLHAAPPWFVLSELLGAKDVRLYDDSMSEWANSNKPTETSTKK